MNIHNQREATQILSTKQENLFQNVKFNLTIFVQSKRFNLTIFVLQSLSSQKDLILRSLSSQKDLETLYVNFNIILHEHIIICKSLITTQ